MKEILQDVFLLRSVLETLHNEGRHHSLQMDRWLILANIMKTRTMQFYKLIFSTILVFITVFFVGCSKPVLDIPDPQKRHLQQAKSTLSYTSIAPAPTFTGLVGMQQKLDRVTANLRSATFRVCHRFGLEMDRCEKASNAPIKLHHDVNDINAYADHNDTVGVYGGLTNRLTEDEVAAVIAHEFSHVMLGHSNKTLTNALVGMLIGAGVIAALADSEDIPLQSQDLETAMDLGGFIGSRVYSKDMEIEADHIAIHILKEAGYSTKVMRDAIIRLSRIKEKASYDKSIGKVGFLRTHPTDERRMAHILKTMEEVKSETTRRNSQPVFRPSSGSCWQDGQYQVPC